MVRIARLVALLACVGLAPSAAWAQATLAGTVKDASGAVLPGVTVEASSPVLIEKTRSGHRPMPPGSTASRACSRAPTA